MTGGGRFVDDLTREGALHLGVVRSAEAHARLKKVATGAARALPGVVLAWNASDLGEIAPNMPTAYGGAQKGRGWAQPVLARDLVRHVGEPVAVVVAETAYQLADALDAVTVEYERLPALSTTDAALAASAARLHEGWPDNTAVVARGAVGDPERAMAGAHLVVSESLRHPRLSAVPIETRGVLAYRDSSSGVLVVSSSTQSPYTLRDVVAAALARRRRGARRRSRRRRGFGPKGPIYPEEILVAAAAHRLGRPVGIESRREPRVHGPRSRAGPSGAHRFARGAIVAVDAAFRRRRRAYPSRATG